MAMIPDLVFDDEPPPPPPPPLAPLPPPPMPLPEGNPVKDKEAKVACGSRGFVGWCDSQGMRYHDIPIVIFPRIHSLVPYQSHQSRFLLSRPLPGTL